MIDLRDSEDYKKTESKLGQMFNALIKREPLRANHRESLSTGSWSNELGTLDFSRITEQALSSILDYLETQNKQESSEFLSPGSFEKKEERARRELNPGPPDFHALREPKSPVLCPY